MQAGPITQRRTIRVLDSFPAIFPSEYAMAVRKTRCHLSKISLGSWYHQLYFALSAP